MRNSKKLRVIIILGPPGSGKGTQSELLAEKTGLYHLEASEVIVENLANVKQGDFLIIDGKKCDIWEEKKKRERGEIMDPLLIAFWTKKKIREIHAREWGIIFSGNPRTILEAEVIMPLLESLYGSQNIQIFLLKQRPEVSIFRNSHRKTCQLLRHPVLYTKETKGLKFCPLDGSELVVRKDDDPEIIRTRLREYKKRTLPMIKYFKSHGFEVEQVDAEKTVAEIFFDFFEKLRK